MKEVQDPPSEGTLVYWRISGGSRKPRLAQYFAMVDGRAECVRVEIGAEFEEGENPRSLGAKFAPSPRLRALQTSTLRDIKLHAEIKKARKEWVRALDSLSGEKVSSTIRRAAKSRLSLAREAANYDRPGPPYRGKQHFEEVARVYEHAYQRGGAPTTAVADHFDKPYPTAARWVSRARHEYGLLPKTRRGKARSKTRSPK